VERWYGVNHPPLVAQYIENLRFTGDLRKEPAAGPDALNDTYFNYTIDGNQTFMY